MTYRRMSGFTLIELLIAVAILAVLGGSVGPMLMSKLKEANEAAMLDQLKTIKSAWQMYYADTGNTGHYAEHFSYHMDTCSGARMLTNGRSDAACAVMVGGWRGPYTERPLITADNKLRPDGGWYSWGNSYWDYNGDGDYSDGNDYSARSITIRFDSLTVGCLEASALDLKLDNNNMMTGYGVCKTGHPDWSTATANAAGTYYFISMLMR